MSVDPADDPAVDPAAQRVADFVSAEVGPRASTLSSEKAFVHRLARYRQTRRNRRRLTVGAAVAAVLVVGLAGSRFRQQAPTAAVLNYRVDNQDPPSGGYLAPQTAESLVAFSDGSKVQMAAQARGRVVEVGSRGARFALDAGQATAEIVHRPHAQWIFEAGPFRVTVHGTSFSIAWNPVDTVFEVRLASGAISVASPVAGPEIQMRAGQTLRVSLRDQSSTLGSVGTSSGGREVPSPAENTKTKTAPASSSFEPPRTAPRGPAEPPRWSHRGWMSALSQNRARDILADAERHGPTSVIERADSEDLWALATAARYAGRHALAGQALNAHRRRFPSTARSREAAFLLGRLHDGDPDPAEALRWYDRYLVDAHDGVGVADALGRKMTLLERSNRRAEALAVAREYLRRSPQGTYANAARALVRSSTTGP